MRYRLNRNIVSMQEEEDVDEGDVLIEVITFKEYQERYETQLNQRALSRSISNMSYCKADLLKDCVIGTFVVPNKEKLLSEETAFCFYVTKDKVVFVDDSDYVEQIVQDIATDYVIEETFAAHFFFEFMECLIKEDVIFLQKYERKLTGMEEQLLKGEISEFDRKMLVIRKELLALHSYYQQLIDVSETLEENQNKMFGEEDCRLFDLFSKRADRLYDNTQMLQDYSLQLHEMYKSQIDIRQNKIMQFLTVVTTIFMPLTLIAGWYGMNFINMPELKNPYGYLTVIIVSVATILVEIWFFKIKKWFQ